MSLISYSPLQDGVTGVNAAATNTPLSTIYDDYNGNITDANISASAAIASTKLAAGAAWASWTPTWTNVSGGATTFAKYIQIGKTVHFRIKYTLAGAGVSGAIIFSTPTSIDADNTVAITDIIQCSAQFTDTSAGAYSTASTNWQSSSTIGLYAISAASTYLGLATTSSTIPFVWATGDVIEAWGTYEST